MRHLIRLGGLCLVAAILAGCAGQSADSASPSASAAGTAPPASASGAAAPSAEPIPSDALGSFSCDLPIVETTPGHELIVDVRVGTHADYDRVVFEFADGLPEMRLERASPPFTHDASGLPVEVEGTSFLRLSMPGGTKQTNDGTSSYDGPTDFQPGFPMLVHLVEGGDFEAHSTWYIGLNGPACARVSMLTDDGPPRLVIDVEN